MFRNDAPACSVLYCATSIGRLCPDTICQLNLKLKGRSARLILA